MVRRGRGGRGGGGSERCLLGGRRLTAPLRPAPGTLVPSATRILIAEDETIIRLDLRDAAREGRASTSAQRRTTARRRSSSPAREQPDLALLDVKMPKLDGIDAARQILDERPIPIVMVTAYGEQELVSRAVEAGVFGYLVKPFRETICCPRSRPPAPATPSSWSSATEADSLAEALAARKAIERAKGLLMEREGLSEQEAYARLRKASQISGPPATGRRRGADRHTRTPK